MAERSAKIFGNYEVLSLLGRGGMAEVFRARVRSGPREGWAVALKRLLPELATHPDYIAAFAAEADLTRLLDHPNIVRVLEVGVHEDVSFIVMELVDGRDLGQVIRRCRQRGIPLPLDFALFLARTLLDALASAHDAKGPDGEPLELVHCDVSPSNLFVSRVGEIKLGDFGVARARMNAGPEGGFHGKPYYVSPEVLAGEVTWESDLWAATVTLYELLTLQRPFTGETPEAVFAAVRRGDFRPPSTLRQDIPQEVDAIVARGFSGDRTARFPSARAFGQMLEPLYDERVGNPMAIAAVVRGLFGAGEDQSGSGSRSA